MNETVRLQSSAMRAVGAVAVAFAVLQAGNLAIGGAWWQLATWAGPLGLLALVGVAGFWLPYVEISDGYVELRNVTRTVRLPWPAIEDVDGRYGLQLRTAYGKVTAWGAAAPSGRQRLRSGDSLAAREVRRRHAALGRAGHLSAPRLETERLPARWHVGVLAVGALLLVLTAVGVLVR